MIKEKKYLSTQLDVLQKIAKILCDNNIEYQITGSLAAKFYGLSRMANDIDIETHIKYRKTIEKLFKPYITIPFYHYEDDFYNEDIIECNIDGIIVEICFMDGGTYHSYINGRYMSVLDFYEPVERKFRDTMVNVCSIDKIIGYKIHNLNPKFVGKQIGDALELIDILKHRKHTKKYLS